ncbi:MAG: glycosyltransferase [Ruminococcaceae bacterium]|nr:glycosyltransferase [Oscillospiraceae bacterium]
MKILIVNAILYTSETHEIKKVSSIKDTMIYDLCLAFKNSGHEVTLFAADDYKPVANEEYPFEIYWAKTKLTKLFPANVLPYCPSIKKLLKSRNFDLVITSEVFSLLSFMAVRNARCKVVVWQELAKHNNIMHKIPSKLWYGIIARMFYGKVTVVARSEKAKKFISKYCKNVSDKIIDHGVNLEKFSPRTKKENFFIIPSQLIARKQIDLSIRAFADFVNDGNDYNLYIFGEGEEHNNLQALAQSCGIKDRVKFFGKVPHETLKEYLAKAQAMLIYTRKDNNLVSVVESIACGTPVITTTVPYNAAYISKYQLGIADDEWCERDLDEIVNNNDIYVNNCLKYRDELSDNRRVEQFMELI